jgi:transcriptional regulator with XRE-family HTH domain
MNNNDQTLNRTAGRRIAAARRAAGLTQAELATKLNWPRDTLIHYEHGRRAIAVDRLATLAAALDIPPATLLMDDDILIQLFTHLAHDPYLPKQVLFFLSTLEEDEDDHEPG